MNYTCVCLSLSLLVGCFDIMNNYMKVDYKDEIKEPSAMAGDKPQILMAVNTVQL